MPRKSTPSLEGKARVLGLSSDELVELAFEVLEDAADEQAVELRVLIDQVNRTVPETLRIADDRHHHVQELLRGANPKRNRRPRAVPQIDVHVGGRIRLRREMLGLTEGQVADRLGVTRGQFRRFESGARRVGAARLLELSGIFEVPVSYFFDDLDPPPTDPKLFELAHYFAHIERDTDREELVERARSYAAE